MPEGKHLLPKEPRQRKSVFKWIKEKISAIGTLNIVLFFVFCIFLYFNYQMLEIYKTMGSIPESYAIAVVGALIGECGFCGWIRTTKDRHRDRQWQKEDEEKEHKDE